MTSGGKVVVCPCEDITLDELDDAIDRGYETTEEIKRITAVTTGPCQGRYCLCAVVTHLAERTGRPPDELGGITHRSPLVPVRIGDLANAVETEGDRGE